jgi:hypothetical protein
MDALLELRCSPKCLDRARNSARSRRQYFTTRPPCCAIDGSTASAKSMVSRARCLLVIVLDANNRRHRRPVSPTICVPPGLGAYAHSTQIPRKARYTTQSIAAKRVSRVALPTLSPLVAPADMPTLPLDVCFRGRPGMGSKPPLPPIDHSLRFSNPASCAGVRAGTHKFRTS